MILAGTAWNWLIWPRRLGGDVAEVALRADPVFGALVTGAVAVALILLVVWSCRVKGVELSARRRAVLMALRIAALCCLVPALLELSLRVQLHRQVKPVLALAIDRSQSMSLVDRLPASGPTASRPASASPGTSRLDRVKQMLLGHGGAAINRLSQAAECHLFVFDQTAQRPVGQDLKASIEPIEATGELTSIRGSVGEIVDWLRGRPSAGIVLFSDGVHNAGGSPLAACEGWKEAGVPVHTVAVGDPNPRDIEVQQVLANKLLFKGDPATVVARVRQHGYGRGRVTLMLKWGREELARTEAEFPEGANEMNVPLTFTPTQVGEQTFRVECPPRPDETVEQNNYATFAARVTTEKIRVLYLEQRPRWQYRFLRDAMTRDQRLKVKIMCTGSEPVPEPPEPFINTLPDNKEAFGENDLVILGDIDPGVMTSVQMEWIRELVRDEGVGLLLLAGPSFNPKAYVDTPLGDLFPVEVPEGMGGANVRSRAGDEARFLPELTPLGRSHPAIQLGDDPQENTERWGSLPEVFWYAPVRKTRPGASVLAVHPRETTESTPAEPVPILAVQHFGRGMSFYCGIDETWRWRFKRGDQVFYRLWGQLVAYLGAPHLAGGKRGITLETDRAVYSRGEAALVTVRAEELSGAQLPALVAEGEDGEQRRLALGPSPGAAYLYEARVPLLKAGLCKLWLDGHALEAAAVIEVQSPQLELQEPAADLSLMEQIASNTGGQHCRAEGFDQFLQSLNLSARTLNDRQDVALWDRPLLVLLFVLLVGTEWVLRRLWQLP